MSEQTLVNHVLETLNPDMDYFTRVQASTQNQTVSLIKSDQHPIQPDEIQAYVTVAFNAFALGLKVSKFMLIPMYAEIEIQL